MPFKSLFVAAAIMLSPIAALAQDRQPAACPEMDTALPAELAGWTARSDLAAATGAAGLAKSQLAVGHAATVALRHTPDIAYVAQPEKPGGSVAYGGMVQLAVKDAGTYKVGLGSGAWIDVLNGTTKIQSAAHSHGPECSTLRKIVDFALQPGSYVIQISANADPTVAVMVWRQN